MNDQGWLIGPNGEYLYWIPLYLRPCRLVGPDTKFVIMRGSCLDISHVTHGEEWQIIKDRALRMS